MNHLLITGVPGVGKTTLVQRALEQLADVPAVGFVTEEVRQDGRRVGFDVVGLSGERAPLARVSAGGGGGRQMVGPYCVDVAAFEQVALPAARTSSSGAGGPRLLVLDEVGKMELLSRRFQEAVRAALAPAAGLTVLATVPVVGARPASGLLAELRARPDARLLEVTRGSRDAAVQEVVQFVRERLQRPTDAGEPGRH